MPMEMPLSANGRFIVDAHGRRVRLAGVNWYGFHEDLGVAPGLDRTHRRTLAKTIALHGFNSVRLPFSVWMTEQTKPVPDEYLAANPDLFGATPMQVFDACVEALTGAGLIVIPNCHMLDPGWCCSEADGNGLWYNRPLAWPEVLRGLARTMTPGYQDGEPLWSPVTDSSRHEPQRVARFGLALFAPRAPGASLVDKTACRRQNTRRSGTSVKGEHCKPGSADATWLRGPQAGTAG